MRARIACRRSSPGGWRWCSAVAVYLFLSAACPGQTFTEQTGIRLTGVFGASVAWGDYDNDGYLDILLAGESSSGKVARVYRNNRDNTFTEQTNTVLTGVSHASVAWGDYDGDDDLDILLTGCTIGFPTWARVSEVYRNSGGTFLKQAAIALTGVLEGSVAWGDADNDGDLDILLTGSSAGDTPVARIYRNNGNNTFTEQASTGLSGLAGSSASWGDYDNDGDLDIALLGHDSGWTTAAAVYRNNGGLSFTKQTGIVLTGADYGSIVWGDYDNDGDLDLALCGYASTGKVAKVYRNSGGTNFQEQTGIVLPGMHEGNLKWGDYDNDGDLDILLTGSDFTNKPLSAVCRNNGDNTFSRDTSVALAGVSMLASCAWGDYDRDGDLDILLAGADTNLVPIARVYRNEGTLPNRIPKAPPGFRAVRTGTQVSFSWQPASDSQTPSPGLAYNLRVGTDFYTGDIAAPMSSPYSGRRRVVCLGPIQGTNWTLNAAGLSNSAYFCAVQAVDTAFAGSPWSHIRTFSGQPDADADGLSDADEALLGTLPGNADTDGDGLEDGDEAHLYGTLATAADSDGDDMPDAGELVADTDPADPSSRLAFTRVLMTNEALALEWCGGVTAMQTLESTDASGLLPGLWTPVTTGAPPVRASGAWTETNRPFASRFYRLVASGPMQASSGHSIVLGEEHNGSNVWIRSGSTLGVALNTAGGAGYEWILSGFDPRILEFVEGVYEDGGGIGGGGVFRFNFLGAEPGESPVHLEYKRPWETDPLRKFDLTVHVAE